MTDSDFLLSLRGDWTAQAPRPRDIAQAFARHRRWAILSMIAKIASVAMFIVGLAALTALALDRRDALFAIAALAFAFALPIALIDLVRLRSELRTTHDLTPLGLLLQNRVRIAATERLLWGARWCSLILLSASVGLWLPWYLGGAIVQAILPLSALWASTAVTVWVWQARRGRKLRAEKALIERLVDEFEATDGDEKRAIG